MATELDLRFKQDKLWIMKTSTAIRNGATAEMAGFSTLIKAAMRELASIRKANKATDAEIRRLKTSTRKKLSRIQQNLRYVEAVR